MEQKFNIGAIGLRRSIRKYDRSRPVEREKLEQLIRAAMYAPTARNLQPWQFLVVTDRTLLDRIPEVHPYSLMMREATAAILVCGDREKDPSDLYLVQNCSAATQNILLEACAMGLGTVWLGVFGRHERMDGMSRLFALPDSVVPVSLIAVGYPMEEKPFPQRFQPRLIHENRFGNIWEAPE
ncbi:MAG TPA: nitroreductase family protein [Bacteroidales bacterium]|nr:nitroreductase family protein [Bacteroidales bacterium]HRZ48406.1 nitroreductase family protein [Bacteroidales bacterium]